MPWPDIVSTLRLDLLASLIISTVLGAAIGFEREMKAKPAGLRTNTLICVGACLYTELSIALTADSGPGDPSRVAAQIVTGVGFLGAGTIMRGRGGVSGLTTAATIWLVAAIGMAVGAGWEMEAAGATLLTLVVLGFLGKMERFLDLRSGTSRVSLRLQPDEGYLDRIHEIVRESGAKVDKVDARVEGNEMTVRLQIRGARHARDRAKLGVMRATGIWSVSDLDREARQSGSGTIHDEPQG
jgi:putative Mg2+ transporter-C (MgtC) family protein